MLLLPLLLVYITLSVAKRDINEDFHVKFASEGEDADNFTAESIKETERRIQKQRENFTDCSQFLDNTEMDIRKVFNVSWQVFYYWIEKDLIGERPLIFNFGLPNPTLVQRFESELFEKYKAFKAINWTAPELFMETNVDFSAIFFATNQSGLFDVIPSIAFEHKLDDVQYRMALKFIEPHYLGVMNCRYRQLMALAPDGKLPSELETESIARKFKFKSDFGISFFEMVKLLKPDPLRATFIDSEDYRALDMNYDEPVNGNLTMF